MPTTITKFFHKNTPILFQLNNKLDVIQSHHYAGKFYEEEELHDISLIIPTRAKILDIGANIGNHLVYFAKFCRNVHITPFEVNPVALSMLKVNIELNNIEAQINGEFLGIALGQREGFVNLVNENRIANNLGAASFNVTNNKQGFPMQALDQINLGVDPDFIKIDVEGMEIAVLLGAEKTILHSRPPLYVEVSQNNRPEFKKILNNWGYTIERTHQRHKNVINYLCVPW